VGLFTGRVPAFSTFSAILRRTATRLSTEFELLAQQ
jgi:hypothetical protein